MRFCCLVDGSIPAIKLATYRKRLNSGFEVGNIMLHYVYLSFTPIHIIVFFSFPYFLSFHLLNWTWFLYTAGCWGWNKFNKNLLTSEKYGIWVLTHDKGSKKNWISTWDPLLRWVVMNLFFKSPPPPSL